jgi:GWxTD domain-containing protein
MKKMISKISIASLFVVIAFVLGCSTASKVSLTNLASLYQQENAFTEMPVLVFHQDDSTSQVIIEIQLGDMRYLDIPNTQLKACAYQLNYRLLDSYETRQVIDSGSVVSGDTLNAGRKISILRSIILKTKEPDNYVLELQLTDLNRRQYIRDYIPVDRSSPFVRQNYMLMTSANYPIFDYHLEKDKEVRLVYNNSSAEELFVRCYFRDFPLARPPFVEERQDVFDYQADSVFTISILNGRTELFNLEKNGFYHFQQDTSVKDGITLFRFHDGFPEIKTTSELVVPLRYISTRAEYDRITEADDQKEAVDEFWLTTAGNTERAKTLIQKYYSNVQEANYYFTSYHEGWKTDRGIIYIIFGRPDYVYRSTDREEWIYGEPEHRNSLRFDYVKVRNPFTDNDFMLLRTPSLKDPWYITVQSWRR